MKKIPKNLQDAFFMFLSVIGKEFIEKLSEKVEVA